MVHATREVLLNRKWKKKRGERRRTSVLYSPSGKDYDDRVHNRKGGGSPNPSYGKNGGGVLSRPWGFFHGSLKKRMKQEERKGGATGGEGQSVP